MHASIRILGCFLRIAGRSADGCGDVRVPWCGLERTVEDSHPAHCREPAHVGKPDVFNRTFRCSRCAGIAGRRGRLPAVAGVAAVALACAVAGGRRIALVARHAAGLAGAMAGRLCLGGPAGNAGAVFAVATFPGKAGCFHRRAHRQLARGRSTAHALPFPGG